MYFISAAVILLASLALTVQSGLTYPEVSSNVCHDSFCQSDSSVPLPWIIHFETFYLHVVSSFSCIPGICPKIGVIFNSFANLCICSVICPKCILLFFSCISSLLLLLFFWRHLLQQCKFRCHITRLGGPVYCIVLLLFYSHTINKLLGRKFTQNVSKLRCDK